MGLIFFVFGLNGLLNFLPPPSTPVPEGAVAFGGALMKTGYMFQLVKGTEVLVGALLLANRFVPLALALIAPVVVNIFAFHIFLAPDGTGFSIVILALEIYLAWSYRNAYRSMLVSRATPGSK
ncbi:DoxX family protein [Vitiosangium sp. GDMCC 1.1324]|nr:DoxX family protein [Vitiosangium sp. GDMCC 1.1324]